MRDPERIPQVLGALRQAWLAHPDERLGQLLYNALGASLKRTGITAQDLTYQIEEDVWRDALMAYANPDAKPRQCPRCGRRFYAAPGDVVVSCGATVRVTGSDVELLAACK